MEYKKEIMKTNNKIKYPKFLSLVPLEQILAKASRKLPLAKILETKTSQYSGDSRNVNIFNILQAMTLKVN